MRKAALLLTLAVAGACAVAPPPRTPAATPAGYSDLTVYRAARERLIADDRATRLGADLVLTPAEQSANRRLMALKQAELDRTRSFFPAAHSFLEDETKRTIAESPVFDVMRRLPKGGVLHAHGGALGDFRWLVAHATYRSDCYVYTGTDPAIPTGTLRLSNTSPGDGWRRVTDVRQDAADPKAFDDALYRSITLGEEDRESPDIWREFTAVFQRVAGLTSHPEVRAEYLAPPAPGARRGERPIRRIPVGRYRRFHRARRPDSRS